MLERGEGLDKKTQAMYNLTKNIAPYLYKKTKMKKINSKKKKMGVPQRGTRLGGPTAPIFYFLELIFFIFIFLYKYCAIFQTTV